MQCVTQNTHTHTQLTKEVLAASSVRHYSSASAEPFLDGTSSSYVEDMYNSWLRDPASVHTVSATRVEEQCG